MKFLTAFFDIMDELAKHKVIVITLMAIWMFGTVVLNDIYMDKKIPWMFGTTVLKPWMAYVNVISTGIFAGGTVGYVVKK